MHTLRRFCGRLAQKIHTLPHFPGQWRLAAAITKIAPGNSMLLQDNFGFEYVVARGNHLAHLLLTTGQVEPEIVGLVPQGRDTIVDIGCNIGTFALPASRIAKHVIAVDANREMCETLRTNLKLNDVTNVTVIHSAISSHQDAEITFYRAKENSSVSSLSEAHVSGHEGYDTIVVPNTRLDRLFEKLDIGARTAIKIDAEGVSGEIIESLGGKSALVDFIIAEPSEDICDGNESRVIDQYDISRPLDELMHLPTYTRDSIVLTRNA